MKSIKKNIPVKVDYQSLSDLHNSDHPILGDIH